MIVKVFSLLDTKTGIYNLPWFMVHTGMAIRTIIDLAADPNTTIARHPADFVLVDLGTFDDATGQCDTRSHQHLGTVASFLPLPQQSLPLMDRGS